MHFGWKLINWEEFVFGNAAISQAHHTSRVYRCIHDPYGCLHEQVSLKKSTHFDFETANQHKPWGKKKKACIHCGFRFLVWIWSCCAKRKWCHLTENHCIVPLWLLGNCHWTGIAMQHNSCLRNWTIKILKCHYFGRIHLNKDSSTSQHVFYKLG